MVFGGLLGVPLSFDTIPWFFSGILKSGIQLLVMVFFVGTAYGIRYVGFYTPKKKKITSNKDVDSRSTIWGMLY